MATEAHKELAHRLREYCKILEDEGEWDPRRILDLRDAADAIDPPGPQAIFSDEEWCNHFLPAYYPLRTKGLPPDTPRVPEALTGTLRPAVSAGIAAVLAYRNQKRNNS